MFSLVRSIICVVIVVEAALGSARAADLREDLAKLFDAGGKGTPPAVAAARRCYVELHRSAPDDRRIDYAYGLVLVNQHRYADAIPLLAKYLDAAQDDLGAVRAKLWAQMQDKQYMDAVQLALAEVGRFSPPTDRNARPSHVETAEFVGMLLGYLHLIQPTGVDNGQVSQAKNELLATLDGAYVAALDRGQEQVGKQFAQLQDERDARFDQAEAAASSQRSQQEAAIERHREKVAVGGDVIQSSTGQLRDAQREYSVVQQRLSTLSADRVRLGAQITAAQAILAELVRPEGYVETLPGTVVNRNGDTPRPGDRLIGSMNRVSRRISYDRATKALSLSVSLAALNRQASDMDRQILELQARAAELTGKGRQAAVSIAESQQAAAQAEKKARALERRLDYANRKSTTRRPTGPVGRMAQFSTYVPFPYEQEKKRVLGWFDE